MIISTVDPVTKETLELIATGNNDAIGARLGGFTKIAREYARLDIAPPSNLVDAIDALTFALRCDDCDEVGDGCECDEPDEYEANNWDRHEPREGLNWADWTP
jgi:hypothetical protein